MFAKSCLTKIVVSENTLLSEGLKCLDDGGLQILLVTGEQDELVGIVTDGDVRRAILQDISLDVPVKRIMNTKFKMLNENEAHLAQELAERSLFNHVPILDKRGRVVNLYVGISRHIDAENRIDIPVVIMAGGKGTRLSPLTKIIPKPLIPIGDQTMLEKIMHTFTKQGFYDFRIIVNYKKEIIKAYCTESELPYSITFIDEKEFLGTIGGLSLLKGQIDKTFILTNCDVLAELPYSGLLDWHQEHKAHLTILGVRKRMVIPYGVIKVDTGPLVKSIEEKPFYNHVIVSGIYVIEPTVLDLIANDALMDMDELIKNLIQKDMRVSCYPIEDGWFDIGQFSEYRNLLKQFGGFDA